MISISKPKLLSLIIIVLSATVGWESFVLASPAPSVTTVVTPGSNTTLHSYTVYKDGTTTLVRNDFTGDNDYSGTDTATVLQSLFTFIAGISIPAQPVGGVPADGTQFSIGFQDGNYYFSKAVVQNFPGSPSGGIGISMYGTGDNRVSLILNNGVNNDIFNITNAGDIFHMSYMKLEGNKANQSGISNCVEVSAPEIGFFHIELRDCLTDAVKIAGNGVGGNGWNVFQDTWILSCGVAGIEVIPTKTDFRFTGSKFESCAKGIKFTGGNSAGISIVGNNFNNAGIEFSTGSIKQVSIVGNAIFSAPNNAINIVGAGLGSLTNFNIIISGNEFQSNTGTNVAVFIGNFVDGITVTSNQFVGYTSSATVPVTLIQTNQKASTLVTQNSGMGASWTGFGIAQPAVPASTVNQQNKNPYQIRVYITGTGTGITAYKLTDPSGTSNTFTLTVGVGFAIDVDPYAQIALTYTGSPTWVWYGLANLT